MTAQESKPYIVKIAWSIPHYRVPIFKRLSQNPNMRFVVCADNSPEGWKGEKIETAALSDESKHIHWHKIRLTRIKYPPFKSYEWQPEAISFVFKEHPDVVILHGITKSLSNLIIAILCRFLRIPVIDWTQGVRGPERPVKWFIRKRLTKLFNVHMFYGKWARDWYASHGFKKEKLFVIGNSLDYEKQVQIREAITQNNIREIRQRFGADLPDSRLIFHAGRLEKQKKIPLLLSAVKLLNDKGLKIKLVLIGEGREGEFLKKEAKRKGIQDDVFFEGACYEEEVLGQIIMASDLTIVPGAVGLIAMHSLVYGTPVLTCYNTAYAHGPEIEAVVEGETGGYFIDGDVEDIVKKMDYLLFQNPCKPRMIDACKRKIDRDFTPEYQEKMIVRALNSVLSPGKKIEYP